MALLETAHMVFNVTKHNVVNSQTKRFVLVFDIVKSSGTTDKMIVNFQRKRANVDGCWLLSINKRKEEATRSEVEIIQKQRSGVVDVRAKKTPEMSSNRFAIHWNFVLQVWHYFVLCHILPELLSPDSRFGRPLTVVKIISVTWWKYKQTMSAPSE